MQGGGGAAGVGDGDVLRGAGGVDVGRREGERDGVEDDRRRGRAGAGERGGSLSAGDVAVDREEAGASAGRGGEEADLYGAGEAGGDRGGEQVSVSLKSPVGVIWLTMSGALPVFVTVMVCAGAGGGDGLRGEGQCRGAERHCGLYGGGGREEWDLPDASAVGGGAKFAGAAVAGGHGGSGGELGDGRVGQAGAVDAPAVGGGAGGDLRGDVDAGVERDVEGVGVVGIDDDAVGGSVGEVAADVGPVRAGVGGTVEVRRVDAVAGEAHHRGVEGAAGGVVRVGGERGDVEGSGVELVLVGEVVGDGRGGEVGPGGGAGCGGCVGDGEDVAAEAAASVERACHSGVEDGRACVLRGGGAAGWACRQRANEEAGSWRRRRRSVGRRAAC